MHYIWSQILYIVFPQTIIEVCIYITESVDGAIGTTVEDSHVTSDVPMDGITSEETMETKSDVGTVATGSTADSEIEEHDVTYFRKLMVTETERFNQICQHWNTVNSSSQLSEDGKISTTDIQH